MTLTLFTCLLRASCPHALCCVPPLPPEAEKVAFAALVHDRMTEEIYRTPVTSFKASWGGASCVEAQGGAQWTALCLPPRSCSLVCPSFSSPLRSNQSLAASAADSHLRDAPCLLPPR